MQIYGIIKVKIEYPTPLSVLLEKLDEVKEILTMLRVWLTLAFAAVVVLIGGLVGRYDNAKVDVVFYAGICVVFVLSFAIVFISKEISKKTKETRRL